MSEKERIALRDDERQPCEIWTRVMGYHRPVSSFNIGKKSEASERKYFREEPHDALPQIQHPHVPLAESRRP
ncbi:MAG: hypothetical protein JHC34_07130 [Acidobacteria bacterium]|jgi:hypothetical protein|nr:hypothetical protein [Acidobacteriota bacterium]